MIYVIVFYSCNKYIFVMDLVNDGGEITDDYEEGEILDDDNLYDEVSSLEELSEEEIDSRQLKNCSPNKSVYRNEKQHKKKEHKCKDDSVCRQERQGKHCYARIRKNKNYPNQNIESVPEPFKEDVLPKRLESTSLVEKSTRTTTHNSSSPLASKQSNGKTYKSENKGYHEKENRYSNKKQWSNNEKSLRARTRYSSKPVPRSNRQNKSRYSSYSVLESHRKRLDPIIGTEIANQAARSSLLKRLVGSGTAGVKTLRENETLLSGYLINNTETCETNDSLKPFIHDAQNCSDLANDESRALSSSSPKADTQCIINPVGLDNENAESAQIVEPQGKMTVKWKRSMKDDNDELHLRVEALRSVWVKKSGERKKKGFVHQRKVDGDDSLVELLIDSDSDESLNKYSLQEQAVPITNNIDDTATLKSIEHTFNTSDLSGDILKPEDMVIVAQDKCADKPIICEPAVRIVTNVGNTVDSLDSVFIASSLTIYSQQKLEKPLEEPHEMTIENKSFTVSNGKNGKLRERSMEDESRAKKHSNLKTIRDRRLFHHRVSKTELRSSRRKVRKKMKRDSNNFTNLGELDDETILREQALLTLKSKINRNSNKPNAVNLSMPGNSGVVDNNIYGPTLPLNELQPEDKHISRILESEVNGATSSDNLEEDDDVDILRAKLLSSISKQVTEFSHSLKPDLDSVVNSNVTGGSDCNVSQSVKTVIPKIQERKKLKILNKGIWKQTQIPDNLLQMNNKSRLKHYGKHNFFTKKDNNKALINSVPQIPKMIISVNDSDSGSDVDMGKFGAADMPSEKTVSSTNSSAEIEAKVDLFLREAEKNIQLTKFTADASSISSAKGEQTVLQSSEEKCQAKKKRKSALLLNCSSSTLVPASTPQAVKHLPVWQQEEYRRLKKKIAEREHHARANKLNEYPKDLISNAAATEQFSLVPENSPPEQNNISIEPTTKSINSDLIGNVDSECTKNHTPAQKLDTRFDKNDNNIIYRTNNSSGEAQKDKSNSNNFVSGPILEDIEVMNEMVNEFRRHSDDYYSLMEKLNRFKKIIKNTEARISAEKNNLFKIHKKIEEDKERISSNISSAAETPPPSADKKNNKAFTREMELVNLKYKEVSLKAQVLFQTFSFENSNQKKKVISNNAIDAVKNKVKDRLALTMKSPAKKNKIVSISCASDKGKDIPEPSGKRCFSGKERERGEWDPDTPVCHYDLNGICRDEECKYQHFKTI